jgi:TPR repeat protein
MIGFAVALGTPREGFGGRNEVLEWYKKAARLGHVGAAYHVGRIYEDGLGVEVSGSTAQKWYLRAAE